MGDQKNRHKSADCANTSINTQKGQEYPRVTGGSLEERAAESRQETIHYNIGPKPKKIWGTSASKERGGILTSPTVQAGPIEVHLGFRNKDRKKKMTGLEKGRSRKPRRPPIAAGPQHNGKSQGYETQPAEKKKKKPKQRAKIWGRPLAPQRRSSRQSRSGEAV